MSPRRRARHRERWAAGELVSHAITLHGRPLHALWFWHPRSPRALARMHLGERQPLQIATDELATGHREVHDERLADLLPPVGALPVGARVQVPAGLLVRLLRQRLAVRVRHYPLRVASLASLDEYRHDHSGPMGALVCPTCNPDEGDLR